MKNPLIDEMLAKFSELLSRSPARDMEQNAKAVMKGLLQRMDVVGREDFDRVQDELRRVMARLETLEARVAELESGAAVQTAHSPRT